MADVSTHPPRIALVLGGGGIAGYSFHAGALAALEKITGWDPRTAELIVGTSAGSSIAAVLRGNVSVPDLVDRILSVPTDPDGMDRLRRVSGRGQSLIGGWSPMPASLGLVGQELQRFHRMRLLRMLVGALPKGRLGTGVLGEQAARLHPCGWPERSLWIPAVRLDSGELTVFGRDEVRTDVATAVAASCAIPAFFQPVEVDGHQYVDGGVGSIMNLSLLEGLDFDLVVAVSPLSLDRFGARSPVASVLRGLPKLQLANELRRLRSADQNVLLLEPDRSVSRAMGANPMDPTRVVPVLVGSAMSITERISRPENSDRLQLLAGAAAQLESPSDVPYPD